MIQPQGPATSSHRRPLHRILTAFGRALVAPLLLCGAAAHPPIPTTVTQDQVDDPSERSRQLAPPTQVAADAFLGGRDAEALAEFERLLKEEPEQSDAWTVYRAEALGRLGRLDDALQCLADFEGRFPASPWMAKARFRRAELARAANDPAAAERILREEAKSIRGPKRRDELCAIYLEVAARLITEAQNTPGEDVESELLKQASRILERALKLETSEPVEAAVRAEAARAAMLAKYWGAAAQAYTLALESFRRGTSGFPSSFGVDAQLAVAWAQRQAGEPQAARRVLQDLGRELEEPSDDPWLEEVRGEVLAGIGAAWNHAGRRDLAITSWEKLLEQAPDHPMAAVVSAQITGAHRALGRVEEALASARKSTELPAPGPWAAGRSDVASLTHRAMGLGATEDLAREAQAIAAHALYVPGEILMAASRYDEALEIFSAYVRAHTGEADWAKAEGSIVDATYRHAASALERTEGDVADAQQALDAFAAEYPLDARRDDARLARAELLGVAAREWMKDATDKERRAAFRASVEELSDLAARMPGSATASQAFYRAGLIAESELEDPARAVKIYRQVSASPEAEKAERRRLAMLKESLQIATPRLIRTGEPIEIELFTRNIEEVEVQTVRLNLGAYFQRHHRIVGIEDLDLDLIAPDAEAAIPVADYQRYAPLRRTVAVPLGKDLPQPGAFAVSVLAAGKRATTLVIQSDLDMIAKRSSGEVFVFVTEVQGSGDPKPAEGVEVSVSHTVRGERVLTAMRTGAGGIARMVPPEGETFDGETRIFAVRNGHVAAVELEGGVASARATKLGSRAALHTDRSAYRPGETVGLRAVLRAAKDGRFVMPMESGRPMPVRFQLVAPDGEVAALTESAPLSSFGTASASITLDGAAQEGAWTVQVLDLRRSVWATASFSVAEFDVPRAALTLDAPTSVVLRGETVQVTAKAATGFGVPLAGATIRWIDPEGLQTDAVLDGEGQATFVLKTTDVFDDTKLRLRASLPESGDVGAAIEVRVAQVAMALEIKADRDVVLAGSSFNALLKATSADGSPIAAHSLVVTAVRTETQGDLDLRHSAFREVVELERTVETNDEGRFTVSIPASGGGPITLRVQGRDAFDQRVEATASVFASGADDADKLRILESDAYRVVGDRARVEVLDRSGGGLALVTVEGTGVIEHRIVKLVPEVNVIQFDVSDAFVPDVEISIAAVRNRSFHHRTATLRVSRPLVLEVQIDPETSPAKETVLTLRTTDGLGNPVSAEVAVSLIDAGLLALFPDRSKNLEEVFAGRPARTPSFKTGASSTFEYRGKTEEIDQAILDEAARDAARLERQAMGDGIADAFESTEGIPAASAAPTFNSFDLELDEHESQNQLIGIGGGAGGRSGGQFGGRSRKKKSAPPRKNGPRDNPTAYWNAAVVTDGTSGQATVTIPMPPREARWLLSARGVTADHRFGEAESETVTSAPFVLDVTAPSTMFVGDAPRVMAQLFASTPAPKDTKVQWELRAETPGGNQVLRGEGLLAKGKSRCSVAFEALKPVAESSAAMRILVSATVDAATGESVLSDASELRVRPGGIQVFDTAGGTVTDLEVIVLDAEGSDRQLTLSLGASASAWLVYEALASQTPRMLSGSRRISGPEELAASLFGAASILNAAGAAGGLSEPERSRLQGRCHSLVSGLVARRADGGGWSTSFATTRPDAAATARVLVALNEAQKAGIETPRGSVERARGILEESLANERDAERRAWILWGQSAGDRVGDDLALGRMHRERADLSAQAGGALACALADSGKEAMAAEVAESLRVIAGATPEANAMALLGRSYAKLSVSSDFEALYGMRPWGGTVGRGLSCAASAKAGALVGAQDRSATFQVRVNGGDAGEHRLDRDTPVLRLDPPLDGAAGPVRVELDLLAGSRLDYAISLSAVTDKTPAPTIDARVRGRDLLSARPRREGRTIDTGFQSVNVSRDQIWTNKKTELEFGQEARILMRFSRTAPIRRGESPEDYEIELPLPAGVAARPIESSGIDSRMKNGSLFVSFPNRGQLNDFEVVVVGVAPGIWTLPPPVIRGSNDPGRASYGEPLTLTVLGPREESGDAYRATPDELLDRGRAAFEAGAFTEARGALRPLFREWREELSSSAIAETAKLLLFSSLSASKAEGAAAAARDAATPNQVVDWFEILKERDPGLFVSFDDTMLVAGAYESIGEFDRAASLFRAVIDETFGEDMRVATALDELGLWNQASAFIAETWSRYPDSPKAQDADFALAARLIERGLGDADFAGASAASRKRLVLSGLARLMRIAAVAPASAAADAGLAIVSAFVELEDWDKAAERAAVFGAAFETPRVRDEFRYTEAVARWSMGQDDEASTLLSAIIEAKYPAGGPGGRTKASENRELALYILGQIHHARREPASAIGFYERIAEEFPDAKAALAELRSERLNLMEDVIRVAPGEVVTVAFRHRGIDEVEVLIYPVDLMTLALRERDLSRVTAVDLAGVTPTRTETVQLTRAVLGLESGELTVDLEEPGAYLAMLRAGLEHRSALILVSDLEVDVDVTDDGSVRAHLRHRSNQLFPRGAEVRVLDAQTGTVASGKTDPRGLFTASTQSGNVTVIARTPGKHYAFAGIQSSRVPAEAKSKSSETYKGAAPSYLQNVFDSNRSQVIQSQDRFNQDVQRRRKGIQIQSAGKR